MSNTAEPIPLYSIEAEMSLIGSVILHPRMLDAHREIGPEHFYRPSHRTIWRELRNMALAGVAVDAVTYEAWMRERGELVNCGGMDYFIEIATYVPSAANADYYARIVKEKADRRVMKERLESALRDVDNPEKRLSDLRADVEKIPYGLIGEGGQMVTPISDIVERIANRSENQGLPTGILKLDAISGCNGLPRGQVTTVCGRSGRGKSTTAMSLAFYWANCGLRVAYVTVVDLTKEQLTIRGLRWANNGISCHRECGSEIEHIDLDRAVKQIEFWDLDFYDSTQNGAYIESIEAYLLGKHAIRPYDAVCMDYAQEMRTSDRFAGRDMISQMDVIAKQIRRLASRMGLPLVLGSQLTQGKDGQDDKPKYGEVFKDISGFMFTVVEGPAFRIDKVRFGDNSRIGRTVDVTWDPRRECYLDSGVGLD